MGSRKGRNGCLGVAEWLLMQRHWDIAVLLTFLKKYVMYNKIIKYFDH
jgi:hypothetical protein